MGVPTNSMGPQGPGWQPAKMSEEAKALNRIADALERQAEATLLLARATAGEFDEAEEGADLNATPLPEGYKGMRDG